MEQLRKDVFDEFKTDLCFELDCPREPAGNPVAESKTNSASEGSVVEGTNAEEDAPSEEATRVRDVLRQWAEQARPRGTPTICTTGSTTNIPRAESAYGSGIV